MNADQLKPYVLATIKLLVFLLAAYYLFEVLRQNLDVLNQSQPNNWYTFISVVSVNVLLYGVVVLVLGWSWLSITNSNKPALLFKIYLKSQIYKYIPSNLMHFVYRHTASKKAGLTHQSLVNATISESVSLIAAALITASLVYLWPAVMNSISAHVPITLTACIHLVVMLVAVIVLFYKNAFVNAIKCFIGHLLYFIVMGAICFWLVNQLNIVGLSMLQLTSIYAIAWLCGYLIPGAPGGLGVREAVFVFLGGHLITPAQALVLIATIRLISILGEILVYFVAQYMPASQQTDRV